MSYIIFVDNIMMMAKHGQMGHYHHSINFHLTSTAASQTQQKERHDCFVYVEVFRLLTIGSMVEADTQPPNKKSKFSLSLREALNK